MLLPLYPEQTMLRRNPLILGEIVGLEVERKRLDVSSIGDLSHFQLF
jgi:hypothetical protein